MCQDGAQIPRKTGARSHFPSFPFSSSPARFLFSSPQPPIIDVINFSPESGFRLRDLWIIRLEGRVGGGGGGRPDVVSREKVRGLVYEYSLLRKGLISN